MKKITKINKVAISLAVLSATGIVALASCGTNKNPLQVPGVQVYARTNPNAPYDDGEKAPAVYYDDKIISYKVENADNLKYGEQDVVVHINPKTFFYLTKDGYDPETWEGVGDPIEPYVGLGSPTNRYSYPLARTAWKYETETSNDMGKGYKLTIKKQYFQKNIVIAYGYKQNGELSEYFPTYVESDFYKENVHNLSMNTAKNLAKGQTIPDKENMHPYLIGGDPEKIHSDFVRQSDFSVISEGIKLRYQMLSSHDYYGNDLTTFATVPTTFSADGTSYAQIKVYGVVLTKDESGEPTNEIESVDELTKYVDDTSKFDVYNTNASTRDLTVFINWSLLIKDNQYNPKYDKIYVGMDPLYSVDVKLDNEGTSSKISHLKNGYCYGDNVTVSEQDKGYIDYSRSSFKPADFVYEITDENGKDVYVRTANGFVDDGYRDKESTVRAPYFATFCYDQSASNEGEVIWPKVTITYTNSVGATSSIALDKECEAKEGKPAYLLEHGRTNFLNSKWHLVCVDQTNGVFALYPTAENIDQAFIYPSEWSYAKKVNIKIS